MLYLFAVTVLWSFSFSLIGVYLTNVDPWFSILVRTLLAFMTLLPFLKFAKLKHSAGRLDILRLAGIGSVQLGVMYGFYYHSFAYLSVPEVLLFTIFTPLYITLINDILDKSFRPKVLLAAAITVVGAMVLRYKGLSSDYLLGFMLVQGANVSFAVGQILYRRIFKNDATSPIEMFGWFYLGSLIIASIFYVMFGDSSRLPTTNIEWAVLIYLGVIASGLGYLGWNHGATKVNVGSLATMNNLLIPFGLIVNLVIWNRSADLVTLSIGASIIFAGIYVGARSNS